MTERSQGHHDWFISAIVKDGSVGDCLEEVSRELTRKANFISDLYHKIAEKNGSKNDAISDISVRVKMLESTLKFRLSILSPERRGAWFRPNVVSSSGPFSGAIFSEPVFVTYDEQYTNKVKVGLQHCWRQRNLVEYPLRANQNCLWKILLSLNFEWHQLGNLGSWPRLDRLPDELPVDMESRALRAFLLNVKSEYGAISQRLSVCFDLLWEASERYWQGGHVSEVQNSIFTDAEHIRRDFKKRRATPTIHRPVSRPIGKSSQDIEALRFMGFSDFPDGDELKQRYHSLALDMHPDREGGNESRFKMLAKSYRHLSRFCLK